MFPDDEEKEKKKFSNMASSHRGSRWTSSKLILGLLCAVLASHRISTPSCTHMAGWGVALALPRLESSISNPHLQDCCVVTIRAAKWLMQAELVASGHGPWSFGCHFLLARQSRTKSHCPPHVVGFCFCNWPPDLRPM